MKNLAFLPLLAALAAAGCLRENLKDECESDADCLSGRTCQAQVCAPPPGAAVPKCTDQATIVPFTSTAEVPALIAGRWSRCGGGQPSSFEGRPIELTAEGEWFELRQEESGRYVRNTGLNHAGTYQIVISQGQSSLGPPPPPRYTIHFHYNASGGGYIADLVLTKEPRMLQLSVDLMAPFNNP